MDPLTQGTLGAALPQATRHKSHVAAAGVLGFLSGMAADLDILIRSPSDSLLFLEYHRQFTHSLIFIPLGGLLMALALHWIFGRRWKLSFLQTALLCTLGYATHALLDAATSYGTMLFWPFSDERVAWKIISIIDPLFTLPILALVAISALYRRPGFARLGLVWAGAYLALGVLQHQTALGMAREIASGRGHQPVRIEVRPSFGNMLVWKTLYQAEGRYYVDAVRAGIAPRIYSGDSIATLDLDRDFPWVKPGTQQAKDIERFRWFSDGYIARDPDRLDLIIDVRYSMVPNQVAALWSIKLSDAAGQAGHAQFRTHRRNRSENLSRLWDMIFSRHP